MTGSPLAVIDERPMSAFQWRTVAIMVGLNALDGFDVLSISFASPGITKAWGIDRAALGIVLSMELVGMALGSIVLGGMADRIGRRRTILMCLCVMAAGMLAASTAQTVGLLCVWRVVTGLGIGGMLAATNAAVAEASNRARRNFCVVIMAAGYPIGAVIGGSIAAVLLRSYGWPVVFEFGAVATLVFIPLVLLWAPESIAFLAGRRPPGALEAINRTLTRMRHPTIDTLPALAERPARLPLARLFSPMLLRPTVLLTLAYFGHIMTFYFILKWVPKIVVDMGFAPSAAAGVLVWANVGGAAGAILFGLLTAKIKVRALTISAMAISALMIAFFGHGQATLAGLSIVAGATGFFTNGGIVGLYALVAERFDTDVRATATGFAIGVGRGGSALAPAVAGFLFQIGYGLQTVAILMAMGSVVALISLSALGKRPAAVA